MVLSSSLLVPTLCVGTRCFAPLLRCASDVLQRRRATASDAARNAGASRRIAFPRGAWERGVNTLRYLCAHCVNQRRNQVNSTLCRRLADGTQFREVQLRACELMGAGSRGQAVAVGEIVEDVGQLANLHLP